MVTDSVIYIFDSFMLTPDSKSGTDFFVMRKTQKGRKTALLPMKIIFRLNY